MVIMQSRFTPSSEKIRQQAALLAESIDKARRKPGAFLRDRDPCLVLGEAGP